MLRKWPTPSGACGWPPRSDCRLVDRPFELMDSSSYVSELRMIVRGQRLAPFYFELPNLLLYVSLVQTQNLVMLVHVYPKRLAQAPEQVLFVHLGVALHCIVLNPRCDLA